MCRKLASWRLIALSVLAASTLPAPSFGQENLLSELYGLGAHAYHSRDYAEAYANLTAAVEGGSRDPRVYYFRGLALENLGRPEDAQLDFEKGAILEVATGGDQYPIGKALERVQGVARLRL
ncbi:MAG: hypothetical protein KDA41_12460, partial [Planctomycetales bacterium]|nr:hypothetical protein [Planctomycetales bacterium]